MLLGCFGDVVFCSFFCLFFFGRGGVGGRLVVFLFIFCLFVCGGGVWVWVLRGHFFFKVCFFWGKRGSDGDIYF